MYYVLTYFMNPASLLCYGGETAAAHHLNSYNAGAARPALAVLLTILSRAIGLPPTVVHRRSQIY
jgi:hypothetical protein